MAVILYFSQCLFYALDRCEAEGGFDGAICEAAG